MRKITFTFFLTITSLLGYTQNNNVAKAQKVNGIEVYILCEPLRNYETVIGKGNSIKWTSFITGGLINESISTKVSTFVNGVKRKAKDEGIEFDAIVYTNGKNVTAIKFTEEATDKNDRLAEVQKLEGIPVFIMNEPVSNYTVETDKGAGVKLKSFITAGLINNSIEQDVNKYVKKFKKQFKKGIINAIQYSSGKKTIGIKFE